MFYLVYHRTESLVFSFESQYYGLLLLMIPFMSFPFPAEKLISGICQYFFNYYCLDWRKWEWEFGSLISSFLFLFASFFHFCCFFFKVEDSNNSNSNN